MKKITFLLAAAGALAVMAFAGAGTASATVICDTATDGNGGTAGVPCPDGNEYTGDIEANLVSTDAVYNTSSVDVLCENSEATGNVSDSGEGDGTPNGTVDAIDWYGTNGNPTGQVCDDTSAFVSNATPSALNLSWGVTGSWANDNTSGAANGTFSLTEVDALININGSLDCTYHAEALAGDLFNPDHSSSTSGLAEVVYDDPVSETSSEFLCPNSGDFEARYSLEQAGGGDLWLRSDDT